MNRVLFKSAIFIILAIFFCLFFAQIAIASTESAEIVIEQSTGRILHENNANKQMYMASTTKIMTALVTIEKSSPDELVVIPKEAQGVEGSSIYLKAGEVYTVQDLLYGLMLRSGNDSATALAIHVAGSTQNFAKLMNEKAKEVGALNTNFVNPHGLHDDNHYTTAKDLALITKSAYEKVLFRKIVSSKYYDLKGTRIYNKNKLLSTFDGADGVKTGYTTIAGRCLVSSSTRNGMQVICVTLNCYDMWERSKTLMNNAHQNYSMIKVLDKNNEINLNVNNENNLVASVKEDKFYPLLNTEIEQIRQSNTPIVNDNNLKSGDYCGFSEIYLNNHLIFKENIYKI